MERIKIGSEPSENCLIDSGCCTGTSWSFIHIIIFHILSSGEISIFGCQFDICRILTETSPPEAQDVWWWSSLCPRHMSWVGTYCILPHFVDRFPQLLDHQISRPSDGPRSGMRWGELLLHKKWPVLLAISIALALYVADFLGLFCNILEFAGLKIWMWSEGIEITKAWIELMICADVLGKPFWPFLILLSIFHIPRCMHKIAITLLQVVSVKIFPDFLWLALGSIQLAHSMRFAYRVSPKPVC